MKNIISYSGGKDSTALLFMMLEKNIKIDEIIFCDTMAELPELYIYINKVEKYIKEKYNLSITKLKPLKNFEEHFYTKRIRGNNKGNIIGFPMVLGGCEFNRISKLQPFYKYLGKTKNNIYLGIAYNEKHRIESKQFKNKKDKYYFPLVEWKITEKEIKQYLIKKGFSHPLKRSGCWFCPKQSIPQLKNLCLNYPKLWEKLLKLNEDSPNKFKINFDLNEFSKKWKGQKKLTKKW